MALYSLLGKTCWTEKAFTPTLDHSNTRCVKAHHLWQKPPLLSGSVGPTTRWAQEAVALFILPPLWFLPEKATWIMPGLRLPREMAVFGTHDFKLVPSTLWWLMACDPPWFMASRRHHFLGCKSWRACFPHQLSTVIVSASSTLSGMLAVKEGNGEMGERIKGKPAPSLTCSSPRPDT